MEVGIVAHQVVKLAVPRGLAHSVEFPLERANVLGESCGGGTGRNLLEGRPDRVHLDELVLGYGANPSPPERLGLDEPQGLQVAKRLSDRGLAGSKLLGDLGLDESLPWLIFAVEDSLEEVLLQLLAEDGSVDGSVWAGRCRGHPQQST